MGLILDTHIVLWWILGDRRIKMELKDRLETGPDDLYVSVASLWECEIKRKAGRLPSTADFPKAIKALGLISLPIVDADAIAAASLSPHHGDPFDRMIVAHAINHNMSIVTHDRLFEFYPAPVIWA